MDFLKAQFTKLQQQFGQLTASQKMLSLALMAIMIMTLVLWGRYAGTAEMEPLLDQELATDDFSRITEQLRGRGVPYTANGSRILVPADRRYEVLAELGYDQALPKDTSSAFSEIVGKLDSPLNGPEKSAAIRNEAKQAYLAEILRNFPKVQKARVVIDNTQKRSFDTPIMPVATVSITMKKDQKPDNRLVIAAADLVTGAVAGLQRSHVKVIVDGVSRLFASDDGSELVGGGSGSVIDRIRDAELYFSNEVTKQLAFCDGVMVHVNVKLIDESSESHEEKYDPKGSVSKEAETETETNTTTAANRPAANGDVGAIPNTSSNQGMSLNGGGGSGDGSGTNSEKVRSKMDNRFGKTLKVTKTPGGSVAIMSASVGLPRSFFVKAYKSQMQTDKEPGEAVLGPFIKEQLDKCRNLVRGSLTLPTEQALVVETYADIVPAAMEAPTQAASGVSMMLGGHLKEIALGALAVISLFMVSAMVRKSGPAAAHATARGGGAIATVGSSPMEAMLSKVASLKEAGEDAAEVGGGNGALDGVELDGDAVRAQQVVEQVSTLVKENPDAAAQLVKRWLNRA